MSATELSGYSGHCLYAGFSVSFSNKDGGRERNNNKAILKIPSCGAEINK